MKDKRSTHGIKEVYEWASLLAVENRDSKNMLKYYYWTEPITQLILRLRYLKRGARGARHGRKYERQHLP